VVVEPGEELAFLHPLPVEALWGVGPATRRRLDRFGVRTVGDLAAMPQSTVIGALGEAAGRHLHALAWARDDRAVEPDRAVKSIGHEETYATDHYTLAPLHDEALRMSDAVAARLRATATAGRTVTLKVRFASFQTITRSRTVPAPVDSGPAVARVAHELLAGVDPSPGVRLLGVSVSNLVPKPAEQLRLEDLTGGSGGGAEGAEPAVARAVDEVRRRFGDRAVGPATLLRGPDGLAVKRKGDQQWGPDGAAS
jgi:DNA polymerase-4